jgi:glycogen debranching enzyme
MNAIYEASLYIEMQRLPELYCGFERRPSEGPTAYPVACSPQAWSVAVVFLLIQSCLRLRIDALSRTILFDKPRLPDYLEQIYINNLRTGDDNCSINVQLYKQDTGFNLLYKPENWEMIIKK